jgi:nucleoside-diphosphate kinase
MMKERGLTEMSTEDMIGMILEEMEKVNNESADSSSAKSKKFIMDAFPRTKDDLRGWFETMGDQCIIDHVVYLEAPESVARERIAAEEPHLTEEEIAAKFAHFNQHTLPIITTFQWLGKVRKHTAVSEVSVGFNFLSKYFEKKGKTAEAEAAATAASSASVSAGEGTAATDKDTDAPIHHRSLAIIKPDIILHNKETGNVNKILQKIIDTKSAPGVDSTISIVSYRLVQMTPEIAAEFYDVHKAKPFFSTLVEFMSSGPALIMILDGRDVMRRWREMMGPTDPKDPKSPATCIRALYGTDVLHNAVHGSSSEGTAFSEIDFWTKADGLGTSAQEVSSEEYGIEVPSAVMIAPYPEHESAQK